MSFSNGPTNNMMTWNNQFNASQLLPPGLFSPLSIDPATNVDSNFWSPFSGPSLSPYSCSQAYFQYSHSPSAAKNQQLPIGSSCSPATHSRQTNGTSPLFYYENFQAQMISQNRCQQQFNNNDSKSIKLPKRSDQVDMTEFIRHATIQKAMGGRSKMCTFCKTNGEPEIIYTSHSLKDASDKITCPILQRYVCPDCGATGEKTHTKKYCPVLQKKLRMEMLKKLTMPGSVRN